MSFDLRAFRNEFTISDKFIYLNSGTHSLAPQRIIDKQKNRLQEYNLNPTDGLFKAWGELWKNQVAVAEAFKARPQDLLLRSNVTHPLNEFILSVKLEKNAEILTTNHEYGAVTNICRYRTERDGLALKIASLPANKQMAKMSENDWVDWFLKEVTAKTRLAVIYHIYSGHGLCFPIQKLAAELKKKQIIVVVDGAHTPGSVELDLSKMSNVDCFVGNLHKWWLGPKGTAFAWIPEASQALVSPLMAGWPTFDSFPPFSDFGGGSRFAQKMMLLGCLDFSPFLELSDTREFWKKWSFTGIDGHRRHLCNTLLELMKAGPFPERVQFAESSLQGPLYSWKLPERFQKTQFIGIMNDIFAKAQVQIAITSLADQLYLRLSPHAYNTQEELSLTVERLNYYFK